jgi:hypothetical protein
MDQGVAKERSEKDRGLMLLGRIGAFRDIVDVMADWGDEDPAANWRALHDWLLQANEEVKTEIALINRK